MIHCVKVAERLFGQSRLRRCHIVLKHDCALLPLAKLSCVFRILHNRQLFDLACTGRCYFRLNRMTA
jgi:hypothetical protein